MWFLVFLWKTEHVTEQLTQLLFLEKSAYIRTNSWTHLNSFCFHTELSSFLISDTNAEEECFKTLTEELKLAENPEDSAPFHFILFTSISPLLFCVWFLYDACLEKKCLSLYWISQISIKILLKQKKIACTLAGPLTGSSQLIKAVWVTSSCLSVPEPGLSFHSDGGASVKLCFGESDIRWGE